MRVGFGICQGSLLAPLALRLKPRVGLEAFDQAFHRPRVAIEVNLRKNDVVRVLVLACSGPIVTPIHYDIHVP